MTIVLDFESLSRCDLEARGGRNYWADPSTQPICAVLYDTDAREVALWLPGDPCPIVGDGELAAHNARGFDRFGAERCWGIAADSPRWSDTSEWARTAGLPASLADLGERWAGIPKDEDGAKLTRSLSSARRPAGIPSKVWAALSPAEKRRQGVLPELTPEIRARVIEYCASDVEILAASWDSLTEWRDLEPDVVRVSAVANDRGVQIDVELVRALLDIDARNAERSCAKAAQAIGETPESVRKIVSSNKQWCERTGLADMQATTVEDVLANPARHPAATVALAEARDACGSILAGKLTAMLERLSPDGRLRDSLYYYGGHTGRWSHRGAQLGNMPRPAKRFEDADDDVICRLAERALRREDLDGDERDVLVRACLVGNLVVEDYSGVEARALALCAGDTRALDVIASGRDPYRVAAATIFGVEYDDIPKADVRRNAGKMAELACGYQGGVGALERIAKSNRVNLAATGADPQAIVDAYRELHSEIVRFWYACEGAFRAAARGRGACVDRFDFAPSDDGRDVAIFLPSGRPVVYPEIRVGADGELTYLSCDPKKFADGEQYRDHLYGGKIVENVIQAFCRDLLASAWVRAEAAGLPVVLTVHDEIVVDVATPGKVRDASEALHQIMLDLPEWAADFPIGASGHTGRRYRK